MILFGRLAVWVGGGSIHWASDEIQLAVLTLCAVGCGIIAPFVVLKKMTMFANALSHTSLVGVIGAFLISSLFFQTHFADPSILLLGAFISALLTAGFIHSVGRSFQLQEDAAIGLVFTTLFAVGVILVNIFTRNSHISTEAVMGNPDALQPSDLKLALAVTLLNAGSIYLLYRPLTAAAFDEAFAQSVGIRSSLCRFIILLLTSITAISAFRAIGVVVVLALLVGPYLIARLFSHRLERLIFLAPAIGVVCCAIGVALSRTILSYTSIALSTGGILTAVIAVLFLKLVSRSTHVVK